MDFPNLRIAIAEYDQPPGCSGNHFIMLSKSVLGHPKNTGLHGYKPHWLPFDAIICYVDQWLAASNPSPSEWSARPASPRNCIPLLDISWCHCEDAAEPDAEDTQPAIGNRSQRFVGTWSMKMGFVESGTQQVNKLVFCMKHPLAPLMTKGCKWASPFYRTAMSHIEQLKEIWLW